MVGADGKGALEMGQHGTATMGGTVQHPAGTKPGGWCGEVRQVGCQQRRFGHNARIQRPNIGQQQGHAGGAPHRLIAQPLLHGCDEAIQRTDRPQIPVHVRLTRRQRTQDRVQVKPLMDGPSGGAQAFGDVFGGNL